MKKKQFPSDLLKFDCEDLEQGRAIRQNMLAMWAELSDASYDSNLLKHLVLRYAETEKRIRNLHEQLQEDLASASVIQKTLLPAAMPESDSMEAAWKFQPCDAVGGDIVSLEALDKDHWGCYVLDVAGHGPRAAMVTVSVAQFLKPSSGLDLYSPVKVMDALEKEFPFTRFGSFFTIIYGVVDLKKQSFSFCNAGHPFPALVKPGAAAEFVDVNDHMLGLGFNESRNLVTLDLSSGRSLLLYSDGLTECVAPDGSFYGEDRLLQTFAANCRLPVNQGAEAIFNDALTFASGIKFKDDFTLLTMKTLK